ncbi:MAG: hypothetical protein J7L57_04300 [Deltaproteobacteria bacterium]|nr:hypothetical protein [Candidatus Tharpella sp.]
MRVGDLQQIMLQTDTVGKVQQQGAHGAEVEQSKLAAQQLAEAKEKEKQVQSMESADTVLIRDRETRRDDKDQSDNDEPGADSGAGGETKPESDMLPGQAGKHIDIRV